VCVCVLHTSPLFLVLRPRYLEAPTEPHAVCPAQCLQADRTTQGVCRDEHGQAHMQFTQGRHLRVCVCDVCVCVCAGACVREWVGGGVYVQHEFTIMLQ
jgi:hypothetical protein